MRLIRTCDKCLGSSIAYRYHAMCTERTTEHLHFICGDCSYEWMGRTMDSAWASEEALEKEMAAQDGDDGPA